MHFPSFSVLSFILTALAISRVQGKPQYFPIPTSYDIGDEFTPESAPPVADGALCPGPACGFALERTLSASGSWGAGGVISVVVGLQGCFARVSADFFGESMKGDATTTCISKYVAERYKQEEIITITEREEEIHSG
ncbi:hypothetical protein C8J57DRAFT_1233783 [Mycena rebaudengoi]|nr:hypothetical protein C8J57DRAFT_1233783 [Mycena rebaudengoi]